MVKQPDGLESLLASARDADPSVRVFNFRNEIAAFGTAAIRALEPWLNDPKLGSFAVTVIEKAAAAGARAEGTSALSRGRVGAGSDAISRDITAALERLGVRATAGPRVGHSYVHGVPATAGEGWPGFQSNEFGQIAGTSWRSRDGRTSLAPILTRGLRYHHPHFESYAIERSPEIHFALRERYRQGDEPSQGWRAGKLAVYAHRPLRGSLATDHVAAGLYIERGYEVFNADTPDWAEKFGPVDDRWDWPWLIRALGDDHVRAELTKAMETHGLTLGDYFAARFGHEGGDVGWTCRLEDSQPVMRSPDAEVKGRGWDDVVASLAGARKDRWIDFHVLRTWPAEEAIAAGPRFATEQLLPVLGSLASVYLDIVGPVLPRIARIYVPC